MKKMITGLFLGSIVLIGYQIHQLTEEVLAVESVSMELKQSIPENYPEITDSFFNEEIIGYNEYPVTSIPKELEGLDLQELRYAMDLYYAEYFSKEEKELNRQRIPQNTIDSLQKTFNNKIEIQALEANVAQVKLNLHGDTTYITRIIVPMTFEKAETLVPDNDHVLLAEAVTEVGDRLVLIAYTDEKQEQVLPHHLFTTQHSLFTLSK